MAGKKQADDPNSEVKGLLKKLLILRLFELGVSQGAMSKKLRIDVHLVNDFLKGIDRANG
jgi:hypothetical protein